MKSWTSEFKVGIFVIFALVLMGGSYIWSYDGVREDEVSFTARMIVPSADGLYPGSQVRLAGVQIGAIEEVNLVGGEAELVLRIRDAYALPQDSEAELGAQGLLGDYFVRVYPGSDDELLPEGGLLVTRRDPGDIDTITRNLELISEDISAITTVLREVVEDRNNREHVEATLANVDALSGELRLIAEQNRGEINAIVDSVRRLTESLEGYTDDIAADVDDEMDRLKDLTDNLNDAATDLTSITGKIDRGEGTIGALINERETVDALNQTLDDVGNVVRSFSGLRPEVYYNGRFYMGTQPRDTDTFYYGNPLAWSAANTVGVRFRAHEDFWYVFEINDHPQGVISQREVLRESTGTVESRWTRDAKFRFTFQMEKRWGNFSFRLGIKENGGGIGVTAYTLKDRLRFELDVFDFFFGSYPALQSAGIPNTRLQVRYQPVKNLYIDAGAEQIILGARHGFFTGYVGLGFTFTDDDIRWILQGLPLSF
jgi:phospholipid/cholesterol/gamma-HCH transport system substrate-binding protein